MPAQKPHRSKQNYRTPENFIQAVKQRLGIQEFAIDFAADRFNSQALLFWDERIDALQQSVTAWARQCKNGWGWLNPSYTDIKPWAACCMETAALGGSLAFLVPAAVGSNWFRDYVDHNAYVLLLNGRLAFMPDKPTWLYPKDCILCLYSPTVEPGYEVWNWRKQ